MMESAEGYAVASFGKILINTVSQTRRAAIVNWLVTERSAMVFSHMTDDDIERKWQALRDHRDTECVKVTVSGVR